MSTPALTPKHIRVDREGGWFQIEWADGVTGRIALSRLRQQCPCALCDALRDRTADTGGLHMVEPDEMPSAELLDVVPVGVYAVQIRWADGHDTGIYPYSFLKDLMQEADPQ